MNTFTNTTNTTTPPVNSRSLSSNTTTFIVKGRNQGVLLPQVAVSNKWDRNTFLEQVCIKAGLPPNSWKEKDADIYIFSAEVFGEH